MSYLLYASNEMFSSTELLRQSKTIFDKVSKHEIDKAIILRDGKPSFILFDFATYEKIMQEYEQKHTLVQNNNQIKTQTNKQIIVQNDIKKIEKEKKLDDFIVTLDTDSVDESTTGEIKEFWNK